jgi:hypothetical protein
VTSIRCLPHLQSSLSDKELVKFVIAHFSARRGFVRVKHRPAQNSKRQAKQFDFVVVLFKITRHQSKTTADANFQCLIEFRYINFHQRALVFLSDLRVSAGERKIQQRAPTKS